MRNYKNRILAAAVAAVIAVTPCLSYAAETISVEVDEVFEATPQGDEVKSEVVDEVIESGQTQDTGTEQNEGGGNSDQTPTSDEASQNTTGGGSGTGKPDSGSRDNTGAGSGSAGNTSSGNASSGNTSSGNASSGNTSSGNTSSGNTSSGNASSGNTSSGNASSGNTTNTAGSTAVDSVISTADSTTAATDSTTAAADSAATDSTTAAAGNVAADNTTNTADSTAADSTTAAADSTTAAGGSAAADGTADAAESTDRAESEEDEEDKDEEDKKTVTAEEAENSPDVIEAEEEEKEDLKSDGLSNDEDIETAADWEATLPALTGDLVTDLIAIAQSQIGYRESTVNYRLNSAGKKKGYTRYGAWYGIPYGDWCAMFASFCLYYAGVTNFPLNSSCYAWTLALDKMGLYHTVSSGYVPGVGDLVFFNNSSSDGKPVDHVGIIEKVEGGTITTIEGNSSNMVKRNTYSLSNSRIVGYGELPGHIATESTASDVEAMIRDMSTEDKVARMFVLSQDPDSDDAEIPSGTSTELYLEKSTVDGSVVSCLVAEEEIPEDAQEEASEDAEEETLEDAEEETPEDAEGEETPEDAEGEETPEDAEEEETPEDAEEESSENAEEETLKDAEDESCTLEDLFLDEFVPLTEGIEAGAEFVMVGHMSVPDAVPDGDETPASMNEFFVTEILREALGYDGIIISDSLNADVITDFCTSGEAAVEAIKAGVDLILEPQDYEEAYNAVLEAVNSGEITEERLDESMRRIFCVTYSDQCENHIYVETDVADPSCIVPGHTSSICVFCGKQHIAYSDAAHDLYIAGLGVEEATGTPYCISKCTCGDYFCVDEVIPEFKELFYNHIPTVWNNWIETVTREDSAVRTEALWQIG